MLTYLLIIGIFLWGVLSIGEIRSLLKTINKQLDYINVILWSKIDDDEEEEEEEEEEEIDYEKERE